MNESESGNLNVSQNDDKNELIKKLWDMMENFARKLLEIGRLQWHGNVWIWPFEYDNWPKH